MATFPLSTGGTRMTFQGPRSIITGQMNQVVIVNEVQIPFMLPEDIPLGMKLTTSGVGYGKFGSGVVIQYQFKDCHKVVLRYIYVNKMLVADWIYLPLLDALKGVSPTATLERNEHGLQFGNRLIFSAKPTDDIVVGNILISEEGFTQSVMTM